MNTNFDSKAISRLDSILESETIRILVGDGDEATYLTCHRTLLAESGSASLQALVSGRYKEGRGDEGITWKHEDVDTVKRMLVYFYTGDYGVPKVSRLIAEEDTAGANGSVTPTQNKRKKRSEEGGESDDETPLETRPLTPIARHLKEVRLPAWRINTEAGALEYMDRTGRAFHFGEVFVAHAKVFVLADYHQLEDLMKFSLQRLTQCMVYAETGSKNLGDDFAPLVRYTYHAGIIRRERLRTLVAQFAALHFHELDGEDWASVLEEGGLFMRDLAPRLARRLMSQDIKGGGVRARLAEKYLKERQAKREEDERHGIRDPYAVKLSQRFDQLKVAAILRGYCQ